MAPTNKRLDASGAQRNSLSSRSAVDRKLRAAIKEGRRRKAEDRNAFERWVFEYQKGWC